MTIADLFEPEPQRWGLRGDPYLWQEMRIHFENTLVPDSTEALASLIESAFETLTGHSLSETQNFFMERFSHGGMSGGMISPEFWREQAIPLLRSRHSQV